MQPLLVPVVNRLLVELQGLLIVLLLMVVVVVLRIHQTSMVLLVLLVGLGLLNNVGRGRNG